ncbi:DUF1446 domain-containing protein [soil metagenome]
MLDPAVELAERGNVQYIGFDHLAELTMSILQRMKQKDPKRGYIPDLVPWMKRLLPITREKGIKMLTNAGGANVQSAGEAVAEVARELGYTGMKIGLVFGDDVLDRVAEFRAQGVKFPNLDTGEEDVERVMDRLVSANAYIGSEGQIDALAQGAEVVITGRATDSSVYIAPMVHEFGWRTDDWNLMGAGIAVGHIIECSSGCAGGMSNFWKDIKEPWRVAFPIAEISENGEAIITKPEGSGRMVNEWTVKEHLVYEVHDPANYIMADGIANLSTCKVEPVGPDRVKVSGFTGKERPEKLKLCLGYEDGWIGESEITVCYPDAYEKAQFCEKFLRGRFEALKLPITEMRVDFIGINSIHGPLATLPKNLDELNEVRVRVAVKTTSRENANLVRREVTHLWTHGPVGTTAVISPPAPRQVISLWPTLIPRELVPQTVKILEVK